MHEIIKRNLGYKVISLLLAIMLWLVVSIQGTGQGVSDAQTLTISLLAKNLPANLVLLSKLPPVRVSMKGNNPSFNVNELYAYVDLSGGTPGEHSYPVKIDPPAGINILDMQPNIISLQTDTVQEKMLPVQVSLTGNPAEGFTVGTPVLKPSAVNVRGPGAILANMDKVVVEVGVTGANDTFQVTRPVLFRDKSGKPIFGPDPDVQILNASPNTVDVIVPIQPQGLASKTIPLKVTSKGSPAKGMVLRSLQAVPAGVQVVGSQNALNGFDNLTIGPVDLTDITEDKVFTIPLDKVSLPPGVSFAPGTKITIVAQISPGPIQKIFTGLQVQVKNIPAGLDIDQSIPPIDVTVQGLPDSLKTVTPDQIQLWVDASGLSAGSYPNSKVYWQLPPGIDMVNVPQVTLSLKAKQ